MSKRNKIVKVKSKIGDLIMFKAGKRVIKKWYKGPCEVDEFFEHDNVRINYKNNIHPECEPTK